MTINACLMCLADEEMVDHFVLKCPIAHRVWYSVLHWFGCNWMMPYTLSHLNDTWKMGVGSLKRRVMWKLSSLAVIRSLCKERNQR